MDVRKAFMFSIIAIFLSLLALGVSTELSPTTTGVIWVVNNTNLAPTIDPNVTGTGERLTNTVYYNNNSDIEIFLYSHASSVSQTSDIELFINGTMVSSTSSNPVGSSPEQNNKSIVAVIPRYSYYQAHFLNYHHYEWREYQILSGNISSIISAINTSTIQHNNLSGLQGGNIGLDEFYHLNQTHYNIIETIPDCTGTAPAGTTSVLQFFGVTLSCSYAPQDNLSWQTEKVNKSGDNMTGNLTLENGTAYKAYLTVGLPTVPTSINYPGYVVKVFAEETIYPSRIVIDSNVTNGNHNTGILLREGGINKWEIATYGASTAGVPSGTMTFYNKVLSKQGWGMWADNNSFMHNGDVFIVPSKNLTIQNLSGVGSAYACLDSNGKFYRGTPGC